MLVGTCPGMKPFKMSKSASVKTLFFFINSFTANFPFVIPQCTYETGSLRVVYFPVGFPKIYNKCKLEVAPKDDEKQNTKVTQKLPITLTKYM